MIKVEWTNKDALEGDLISKQDAIKCIRWGEGITDTIERIKALPSADRPMDFKVYILLERITVSLEKLNITLETIQETLAE